MSEQNETNCATAEKIDESPEELFTTEKYKEALKILGAKINLTSLNHKPLTLSEKSLIGEFAKFTRRCELVTRDIGKNTDGSVITRVMTKALENPDWFLKELQKISRQETETLLTDQPREEPKTTIFPAGPKSNNFN